MTPNNKTLADLEADLLTAGIPEKSVAFIMGVLVSEVANRVAEKIRAELSNDFSNDYLAGITFKRDSKVEKAYEAKTGVSVASLYDQISQEVAQEYSA